MLKNPAIIKNVPNKVTIVITPAKGRNIIQNPNITDNIPHNKPTHQLDTFASLSPNESLKDVIP